MVNAPSGSSKKLDGDGQVHLAKKIYRACYLTQFVKVASKTGAAVAESASATANVQMSLAASFGR